MSLAFPLTPVPPGQRGWQSQCCHHTRLNSSNNSSGPWMWSRRSPLTQVQPCPPSPLAQNSSSALQHAKFLPPPCSAEPRSKAPWFGLNFKATPSERLSPLCACPQDPSLCWCSSRLPVRWKLWGNRSLLNSRAWHTGGARTHALGGAEGGPEKVVPWSHLGNRGPAIRGRGCALLQMGCLGRGTGHQGRWEGGTGGGGGMQNRTRVSGHAVTHWGCLPTSWPTQVPALALQPGSWRLAETGVDEPVAGITSQGTLGVGSKHRRTPPGKCWAGLPNTVPAEPQPVSGESPGCEDP